MRLLITCTNCSRRYEAAERKIGTRFRCHCGEVLDVKQPKGHNSSVIRCSSCGGAREKGSRSCTYCNADFTLHERDLHTVCPSCFSRVSDKAKFCSHCGTVLSAEMIAGEDSHLVCPACPNEEKLLSRRLGHENISVLECQNCTGLWLGTECFKQLKKRVAGGAAEITGVLSSKPKPQTLQQQKGPLYRNCVRCDKMMARKQYAHGSGIIIDFCRDHGIWFDADELAHVLEWISQGGRAVDPVSELSEKEIVELLNSGGRKRPVIGRWSYGNDYSTGAFDGIVRGLLGGFFHLLH